MIYNVIYSLFGLTKKLVFFNKQLQKFILSLSLTENQMLGTNIKVIIRYFNAHFQILSKLDQIK